MCYTVRKRVGGLVRQAHMDLPPKAVKNEGKRIRCGELGGARNLSNPKTSPPCWSFSNCTGPSLTSCSFAPSKLAPSHLLFICTFEAGPPPPLVHSHLRSRPPPLPTSCSFTPSKTAPSSSHLLFIRIFEASSPSPLVRSCLRSQLGEPKPEAVIVKSFPNPYLSPSTECFIIGAFRCNVPSRLVDCSGRSRSVEEWSIVQSITLVIPKRVAKALPVEERGIQHAFLRYRGLRQTKSNLFRYITVLLSCKHLGTLSSTHIRHSHSRSRSQCFSVRSSSLSLTASSSSSPEVVPDYYHNLPEWRQQQHETLLLAVRKSFVTCSNYVLLMRVVPVVEDSLLSPLSLSE